MSADYTVHYDIIMCDIKVVLDRCHCVWLIIMCPPGDGGVGGGAVQEVTYRHNLNTYKLPIDIT